MTAGLLAALALSVSVPAPAAPNLSVTTMEGRDVTFGGPGGTNPVVLMLWRPDCAPCLLELSHLRELRTHAGRATVLPLGLGTPAMLTPALQRLGLPANASLRTSMDPAKLLVALNGPPPRLPLSVAVDGHGRVCGRHLGLLGEDQVVVWSRRCGGAAHAQG